MQWWPTGLNGNMLHAVPDGGWHGPGFKARAWSGHLYQDLLMTQVCHIYSDWRRQKIAVNEH